MVIEYPGDKHSERAGGPDRPSSSFKAAPNVASSGAYPSLKQGLFSPFIWFFSKVVKTVKFFIFLLGLFTFLILFSLFWNLSSIMQEAKRFSPAGSATAVKVEGKNYLTIDLDTLEEDTGNPFFIQEHSRNFFDLIRTLRLASRDPDILGLKISISMSDLGLAELEEIRHAVEDFKKAGKRVIVYSDSFGVLGGGTGEYYLASAASEIYLHPAGEVGMTGIAIETPYAKKALENFGISYQGQSLYEYKEGLSFFSDKMSGAVRENTTTLLTDFFDRMTADIALSRKMTPDSVKKLVDEAPFTAEEAVKYSLVTGIRTRFEMDDAEDQENEEKGEDVHPFVDWRDYLKARGNRVKKARGKNVAPSNKGKEVAVVFVSGMMVTGRGSPFPAPASESLALSQDFLDVMDEVEDAAPAAILIRIDSPGGSFFAADEMVEALMRLKLRTKTKVYISIGNIAASGGYYLAAAGDVIYADNLSITGSIGVYGGRPSLEGLWKKWDVTWDAVALGKHALIGSLNKSDVPGEKQYLEKSMTAVYGRFTSFVQRQRPNVASIDQVARGRVFSGERARSLALVDKEGGYIQLMDDLERAEGPVSYVVYSAAQTPLDRLMNMLGNIGSVQGLLGGGKLSALLKQDVRLWAPVSVK